MGIQVDQHFLDRAAENLQVLEEVVRGRVYPCLPSVGVTAVGTSGGTSGGTAGLDASVGGPSLEEGLFGKAAGLQSLVEEERSAWDLGLHK